MSNKIYTSQKPRLSINSTSGSQSHAMDSPLHGASGEIGHKGIPNDRTAGSEGFHPLTSTQIPAVKLQADTKMFAVYLQQFTSDISKASILIRVSACFPVLELNWGCSNYKPQEVTCSPDHPDIHWMHSPWVCEYNSGKRVHAFNQMRWTSRRKTVVLVLNWINLSSEELVLSKSDCAIVRDGFVAKKGTSSINKMNQFW